MSVAKPAKSRPRARPLSPHLQVYALSWSMMMSILHRLTGVALYSGSLVLAWWLVAAASGPEYFQYVSGLLDTWLGRAMLFGYTWALFHHMFGGIRHFFWDLGYGHGKKEIDLLARTTLALSALATAFVWVAVLSTTAAGTTP